MAGRGSAEAWCVATRRVGPSESILTICGVFVLVSSGCLWQLGIGASAMKLYAVKTDEVPKMRARSGKRIRCVAAE